MSWPETWKLIELGEWGIMEYIYPYASDITVVIQFRQRTDNPVMGYTNNPVVGYTRNSLAEERDKLGQGDLEYIALMKPESFDPRKIQDWKKVALKSMKRRWGSQKEVSAFYGDNPFFTLTRPTPAGPRSGRGWDVKSKLGSRYVVHRNDESYSAMGGPQIYNYIIQAPTLEQLLQKLEQQEATQQPLAYLGRKV